MRFDEKLDDYISLLQCKGTDLADRAGLSAAVISRYRSGGRTPAPDGEHLQKLAGGIAALAAEKGCAGLTQEAVLSGLRETLACKPEDGGALAKNFDALADVLGISLTDLARTLNFDASYLSRIRAGQRRPADPEAFADGLSRFAVNRCRRKADRNAISALTDIPAETLEDKAAFQTALRDWLYSSVSREDDQASSFFAMLDDFDLNEYIRSIHFNELKLPAGARLMAARLPVSRSYHGVEQMKTGELEFLLATAVSKSMEPIFMCSDMPMEDMVDDEFPKKWMLGLAMALKKGLHFDIIHNIERPFNEMMLGLESWVPMYMTGQISPWYFPGARNAVYGHFLDVSGAAALSGECVSGFHDSGRYTLARSRSELAYYRGRADQLLKKAQPLMEIYRADTENRYLAFLSADAVQSGSRRSILTVPPLYTLPPEDLEKILLRAEVPEDERKKILRFASEQLRRVETTLAENAVVDELARLSEEEFRIYPPSLAISGAFIERDVFYTYEEYCAHLRCTEAFAQEHPGYTLQLSARSLYRNIQIIIREGKWVMVSKSRAPVIHFVIRQPKLRAALENIVMPYVE